MDDDSSLIDGSLLDCLFEVDEELFDTSQLISEEANGSSKRIDVTPVNRQEREGYKNNIYNYIIIIIKIM